MAGPGLARQDPRGDHRDALVFIACFSSRSVARNKSYQNEELQLAIEQLRLRQPDDPWLIPVRLDECDVPDLEVARAGRSRRCSGSTCSARDGTPPSGGS